MAADLSRLITDTARSLGMSPLDLATIISYETGGSFDPTQRGPTTKWGQHRGLIQFGEPQAKQFGVDWNDPLGSQLGPEGAVAKYFKASGYKPGMGLLDAYSIVNAGGPGKYDASDTAAGGAPGTVRDKVEGQMGGHRQKAAALLGNPPQSISGIGSPFGSMSPGTDSMATSSPMGVPQGAADWALADTSGKKSLGNRLAKAGEALQADMPAPPPTMGGGDARGTGNMLLKSLANSSEIKDWLLQRRAPWLA